MNSDEEKFTSPSEKDGEQLLIDAQIYLSSMNYPAAIYHFRLASKKGYSKACTAIAKLYMNGIGLEKDWRMAQIWLHRAVRCRRPDPIALLLFARSEYAQASIETRLEALRYLAKGVEDLNVPCVKESIRLYEELYKNYTNKDHLKKLYEFITETINRFDEKPTLQNFIRLEQYRIQETYFHPIELFNE